MMKKDDRNIKVFFLKTHVGHSDELTDPKIESNSKNKIIQSRHKSSNNLAINSIVSNGDAWDFHSQEKKESFRLTRNRSECVGKCAFACEECKACIHSFSCTCKDWSVKWNMCIHIHLLCRILNKEQDLQQQLHQQIPQPEQLQDTDTNLDITDLIIYDGAQNEQPTNILQVQVPEAISIEDKNLILSEFSELIVKCNSQSLFEEISTVVQQLKMRVDCEEILRPNVNNSFSDL
ncbi:hypothetical protein WA026_000594 [Henosepilachna vigintioctopunctata]|uniref:SWIM-type domain-containing protein n=1 Tax=Henosepilachna vigintioctopunctata TaxID=420089 RepID=A0AAW1V5F7_9CUCU